MNNEYSPELLCWLGLASRETAVIAARAGFGRCVIDCEHGSIGLETMATMITALKAMGAEAYVRVPDLSEGIIKHALDSGALGVIVPYVETVADAESAVRAFFYPPRGARGTAAAVIAATGYGTDTEYVGRWNDTGRLILQIESRMGLAAAAGIAAVEGVGALFFGPFDYAQDAGLEPEQDGAALEQAFTGVVNAAHGAGRLVGVFPWPGTTPAILAGEGADMIAVASDVVTLKSGFETALQVSSLSISDVS